MDTPEEREFRAKERALRECAATQAVSEVSGLLKRVAEIVGPLMDEHDEEYRGGSRCRCPFCLSAGAAWPLVSAAGRCADALAEVLDQRRPLTTLEAVALTQRYERRLAERAAWEALVAEEVEVEVKLECVILRFPGPRARGRRRKAK